MVEKFMSNFKQFKTKYQKFGTAYIGLDYQLFTADEIKELKKLCMDVPKEHITVGDAGEMNYLNVGRFMVDKKNPELVNHKFSEPLLKIISKNTIKQLLSEILSIKKEEINFRRIQFNEIGKNCFVGRHLDTDSNPDYLAACVIQVGDKFEGGKYRVFQKNEEFIDYSPEYGSLLISDCKYPHEVTKVETGLRGSLVFFISTHKGENRRSA
jgi:hypothetical protein